MSYTAAFFMGYVAMVLTSAADVHCPKHVSCSCGPSDQKFNFCTNVTDTQEDTCEKHIPCKSCRDGLDSCLLCIKGSGGISCTEVDLDEDTSRTKRQTRNSRNWYRYKTKTSANLYAACFDLDSPKLGSIRCSHSGSRQVCTGRCLPGYAFEDHEDEETITLECEGNSWSPLAYFPACKSGGHCDLEIRGGGSFNCTTGMTGTRCDITCHGTPRDRYFCLPGRDWQPELPYCIRSKAPPANLERTPPCPCQNGGSCDEYRNCICPKGQTGTYCEVAEREEVTCPDPGIVPNGERLNSDGSLAPYDRVSFSEGELLFFSCRNENFALRGSTSLRCTSRGTWSSSLPQCIRNPVEPQFCLNPGFISNAFLLNTNGSPSGTGQTYTPGQAVIYNCRSGYALHGSSMLTCMENLSWSSSKPSCKRAPVEQLITTTAATTTTTTTERPDSGIAYCEDPGLGPNAERLDTAPMIPRRGNKDFPQGSRLYYSCDEGFELVGEKTLFCLLTGEWSAPAPSCENRPRSRVYCEHPGPLSNGRISISGPQFQEKDSPDASDEPEFLEGTRLQHSCNDGYIIRGVSTLTCLSSGEWNARPPSCQVDCGRSYMIGSVKIHIGDKTVPGEWPWVVAIAVVRNDVPRIICGGALLDKRTVLTAAHCLQSARNFTLYFGKYHRYDNAEDRGKVYNRTSTRFLVHPRYNNVTYDNDIALMRISSPVDYTERIQPVCKPTKATTEINLAQGQRGYVTGWGVTEKNMPAEQLLMARLPVQSDIACMKSYQRHGLRLRITPSMFCAGFVQGMTSACTGDSGSPLVFYDAYTERFTMEGLVSFGPTGGCGLPGRYTLFTKVSRFMSWVSKNLSP